MGIARHPIVKFISTIEAKWASSSCSPQPDLKAVIADDFQGTATNGHRYGKAEARLPIPRLSTATSRHPRSALR